MKKILSAVLFATLLLAGITSGDAQDRKQSDSAKLPATQGPTVRYIRWKTDSNGISMVWFQIINNTGSDWRIQGISCDMYDEKGVHLGNRQFKLSFVIYGSSMIRETEGIDNVDMPENSKPSCQISRAYKCQPKEC